MSTPLATTVFTFVDDEIEDVVVEINRPMVEGPKRSDSHQVTEMCAEVPLKRPNSQPA